MKTDFKKKQEKQNLSHLFLLITKLKVWQEMNTSSDLFIFILRYSFLLNDTSNPQNSRVQKTSQLNASQGNIYMGARYLDPKYSRWLSTDPALGEYVPAAGKSNDGGNLPGMGGLFNSVNLNLFHYAGNNPVKYTDPDGKEDKKPNVLIVDMPGMTDLDGKLSSCLFRLNIYYELGNKTGFENTVINVIDCDSVKSLKTELNAKKNTENAESIIFIGGHSHIFNQKILSQLKNNEIDLDNNIQIYFATCGTDLSIKEISGKLGVPEKNIHLNNGLSWSDNSYSFLNNVLQGKNVKDSFELYKIDNDRKNKELQNDKE